MAAKAAFMSAMHRRAADEEAAARAQHARDLAERGARARGARRCSKMEKATTASKKPSPNGMRARVGLHQLRAA